mmetsp:Transcript_17084/g.32959  ORF Transcript_17084/g.32959 Transcript_17084/m.32959 type:complete len:260 (+) Transcript_17084:83-862(+)
MHSDRNDSTSTTVFLPSLPTTIQDCLHHFLVKLLSTDVALDEANDLLFCLLTAALRILAIQRLLLESLFHVLTFHVALANQLRITVNRRKKLEYTEDALRVIEETRALVRLVIWRLQLRIINLRECQPDGTDHSATCIHLEIMVALSQYEIIEPNVIDILKFALLAVPHHRLSRSILHVCALDFLHCVIDRKLLPMAVEQLCFANMLAELRVCERHFAHRVVFLVIILQKLADGLTQVVACKCHWLRRIICHVCVRNPA